MINDEFSWQLVSEKMSHMLLLGVCFVLYVHAFKIVKSDILLHCWNRSAILSQGTAQGLFTGLLPVMQIEPVTLQLLPHLANHQSTRLYARLYMLS